MRVPTRAPRPGGLGPADLSGLCRGRRREHPTTSALFEDERLLPADLPADGRVLLRAAREVGNHGADGTVRDVLADVVTLGREVVGQVVAHPEQLREVHARVV